MAAKPDSEECHLEFGWNFTPLPAEQRGKREPGRKMCAERQAITKILENKDLRIVGIITVSREIGTGDPMKSHDALHPCLECRDLYRDLLAKGVLRPDSVICSVNDSKLIEGKYPEEQMTVEELLRLYHDDGEVQ